MSRHGTLRRSVLVLLGCAGLGGAAIGASTLLDRWSDRDTSAETAVEVSTAVAQIRSMTVEFEAEGVLTHDVSIPVASPMNGTVTSVVAAGTTLAPGDVIAVVDDVPVVWLEGTVPSWRTLANGDVGADVAQLESALASMGFDNDGEVTIDDEYTAATADMVAAWQDSIGAPQTGRIDYGTVVFGGERSRVAGVDVTVGDAVAQDAVLASLGTDDRVATFPVTPADAVTLASGDVVSITLPDRSSVEAEVDDVDKTASAWTVTAIFGEVELPSLDVVDVTMAWERATVSDVLTIPSSALLRLDNGSYVVDVIDADASTRRVVEVGPSVGSRVAITAGLSPGDVVVTL